MKLVTSRLMQQIDREAIDNVGIPGPELMENAGSGIGQRTTSDLPHVTSGKVVVICGKGNNGGDGFVIARYLDQAGSNVTVYFIGPLDKLSDDSRLNFDKAAGRGIDIHEIKDCGELPDDLGADIIVDAIFGIGFAGSPRGIAGELIEYINRQTATVIAVDMPSGLNTDNGQHEGAVVRADFTYTLALAKYGLFVSPGRELAGEVKVVPIGIPDEVVEGFDINVELITPEMVRSRLPKRKADGHKGDFGKVLLIAGSMGMTGAAALAAQSALRSGCGLVKVACPRAVLPVIASLTKEATTWPMPDVAKKGVLAKRGVGEARRLIDEHDAVVIGPGLGQYRETQEFVRRLVSKLNKPAIIDADGLNALAGHLDTLSLPAAQVAEGASQTQRVSVTLCLTPHPGEFQRLTGGDAVPLDIHKRIEVANNFAKEHNVVLLLKGSPSIICDPGGVCYLNPTGNHGMASGGTGDVLSGIIGSFLAQGMSSVDATVCGAYVHGLAGDLAADLMTPRAMIAGDILDVLPEAFDVLG